jgi:hypothetical protein
LRQQLRGDKATKRRKVRDFPALLFCACLIISAAVLSIAIRELQIQSRFSAMERAARLIERGAAIHQEAVFDLAQVADGMIDAGLCRSDLLKAGTTLVLRRFELNSWQADYDAWMRGAVGAEVFLRHALSCLPQVGNFWVRYAIVRQQIFENPDEIVALVETSQRYAPAEMVALMGRMVLWRHVAPETLKRLTPMVKADLTILCTTETGEALTALPEPTANLRTFLRQTIGRVGSNRQSIWCNPDAGLPRQEEPRGAIDLSPFRSVATPQGAAAPFTDPARTDGARQ